MSTFAFTIMRAYSIRKGLVHKDNDKKITNKIYRVSFKARAKSYAGTIAYFRSEPLAFVNVYLAFFMLHHSACFIFIPDGIDDEDWQRKFRIKTINFLPPAPFELFREFAVAKQLYNPS